MYLDVDDGFNSPSAHGTTIKALSIKTVLVRCCATPTLDESWNFI